MNEELLVFALRREGLATSLLPDLLKYSEDHTYTPPMAYNNGQWERVKYDFQRILQLYDLGYYNDLYEAEKLIICSLEKANKIMDNMRFDDLRSVMLSKEYL